MLDAMQSQRRIDPAPLSGPVHSATSAVHSSCALAAWARVRVRMRMRTACLRRFPPLPAPSFSACLVAILCAGFLGLPPWTRAEQEQLGPPSGQRPADPGDGDSTGTPAGRSDAEPVRPRAALCAELIRALDAPGTVLSGEVLARAAQAARISQDSLLSEVAVWLDTLASVRHESGPAWEELLASHQELASGRQIKRLIEELSKAARTVARGRSVYPIRATVERAAGKAKVPARARGDLTRSLLACWCQDGHTASIGLPDTFSILVTGSSSYDIRPERFLRGWLQDVRTIDAEHLPEEHRERARSFHSLIVPRLARLLGEHPRIRWAVDRPDPHLRPDCRLLFEIVEMQQKVRRPDTQTWTPGVDFQIQVELQQIDTGRLLLGERIEFSTRLQQELYDLRLLYTEIPEQAAVQICRAVTWYVESR